MGAAWVFFSKPRSKVEAVNDANGHLVNLFQVLQDRFEEFYRRRVYLISSRRLYVRFLDRLKTGQWLDDIDRALMYWYGLRHSFRGVYGAGFAAKKYEPAPNLEMDELHAVHERLKRVYVENLDVEACLRRWDSPQTFFYIDPPFPITNTPSGKGMYQCDMTWDDHRRLAEVLEGVRGLWLMSNEVHPGIRELYRGCHIETVEASYHFGTRAGSPAGHRQELLIANYALPRGESFGKGWVPAK